MIELPEEDFCFLPMHLALAGPSHGFCQIISSRWWSMHPTHGLRFYNPVNRRTGRRQQLWGSPQCNGDRHIANRLLHLGDQCIYIERVFVPTKIGEWHD